MCKQSRLAPNCCHLAQCFLASFSDGEVDSVRVDVNAKKSSSFETEDIIQEEPFFNMGRVLAIENRVGTPPDTT